MLGDGNLDRSRLTGAHADERVLELRREPAAAELDAVVASRVAGQHEVEDDHVADLRRPSVDGREIRAGLLQLVQGLLDELVRDLRIGRRNLERRPVGKLRLLLHGDRRRELPVGVALRQVVAVLGLLDGTDARLRRRVPEPTADVALDRFRVEALLADALDEHRERHLSLAEAGDLYAAREVGCGVLHRVLHVGARHLDGEANLAVAELFDLRLHRAAIRADHAWARPPQRPRRLTHAGQRDSNPHALSSTGS